MVRRTALITAASVAGVVLAGAAVVGANIKILDSAAGGGIGELSATTVPVAETAAVGQPDESQSYAVAEAGTVLVERYGAELRLASVTPAPGWSHTVDSQAADALLATFTDGTTTYQFLATVGGDGNISAGVSQPVDDVVALPGSSGPAAGSSSAATAPSPPVAASGGDDGGGGYDDEFEDDDREDDDREEYEGGEDDD
jgi:hypothetical protein